MGAHWDMFRNRQTSHICPRLASPTYCSRNRRLAGLEIDLYCCRGGSVLASPLLHGIGRD